mgnify:CR=1 FL=1
MKKHFILLLLSIILFSCKKEKKDDSYKYLYDKLDELSKRDHNIADGKYLENYYKIKNDVPKQKRFDSLYKISVSVDSKLKNLDFSNHKKALKFRDSVAKVFGIPLTFLKEDDNKNLNDSIFKIRMELEILNLRQYFHHMKIYDRKEPL